MAGGGRKETTVRSIVVAVASGGGGGGSLVAVLLLEVSKSREIHCSLSPLLPSSLSSSSNCSIGFFCPAPFSDLKFTSVKLFFFFFGKNGRKKSS